MGFTSLFKHKKSTEASKDATGHDSLASATAQDTKNTNSPGPKTQKRDQKDVELPKPIRDQDSATEEHVKQSRVHSPGTFQELFSGAPQFLVETERHGRLNPQVVFPWDKELCVADLADYNLFRHQSFTSATLHAHLSIPYVPTVQPASAPNPVKAASKKRPAFSVGLFEVPNMLDYEGKEPGTIGMRHFLELPIGDSHAPERKEEKILADRRSELTRLSSTEAMKLMQLNGGKLSSESSRWERHSLARDRKSWKEIGVRDISMRIVAARVAVLTPWYNKMAEQGWQGTILDEVDVDTLHDELFTLMLFPPHEPKGSPPHSLSTQIEALVKVLSVPGAWFDFSIVPTRLHLGKYLWELSTDHGQPARGSAADRHWLLIQMLLSVELAIRLDASLRCDRQVFHSDEIDSPALRRYCTLRNDKLDWDIILARAFLDHVYVEVHPSAFLEARSPVQRKASEKLLSNWRQHADDRTQSGEPSPWDCVILPRALDVQVQGLIRFAEFIQWPNVVDLEQRVSRRVQQFESATTFAGKKAFIEPIMDQLQGSSMKKQNSWSSPPARDEKTPKSLRVTLQKAAEVSSGGWLSRSWFTGLILPGESISHILISTLLEHDSRALDVIGADADLYGGFLLEGHSWWSKVCIVGKVMAECDGGAECMGWISLPHVKILDRLKRPMSNQWFSIASQQALRTSGAPRIKAGRAITLQSHPLPAGKDGKVDVESLRVLEEMDPKTEKLISVQYLILRESDTPGYLRASVALEIGEKSSATPTQLEWELTYDVHFVSASPCRVPGRRRGSSSYSVSREGLKTNHDAVSHSHPLHETYHFNVKSISDLVTWTAPDLRTPSQAGGKVCVVHARGPKSNEILARAWCSKVGSHALVSRVSRSCLGCSIREANALDISVIIRV